MSTVISSVTYQGYPCKSVSFKRSDGLHQEMGSVTLDYSVIGELKLQFDAVPWRGDDGGADGPGGMSIQMWWELFGKQRRTRTANKPFSPPGSGFKLFGPLIMTSEIDGGGTETVRYDDIYVVNSEEVSVNLARVREHKFGEVLVNLTDQRQYYMKYGSIRGRINCRLENGKYDPRTIKTPPKRVAAGSTRTTQENEGTPWSFEDVVRYLFSQLPGGPSVNLSGLSGLPAPEEIDHIGASAATALQGVLDNYGLVAKMQPDCTYFVAHKNASILKRGSVADSVGKSRTPGHIAYEVKSASRIDTPAVVEVLGGRRYRRQTHTYVPAFYDLDGKLYRLYDIDLVFDNYRLGQVNAQAAKTPGKNFQDVKPAPFERKFTEAQLREITSGSVGIQGTAEGQAQDDLHYGRRRILREQAYRVYAPLGLFGDDAPRNAKGAPYYSDLDDRTFDFLPMGPAPLFESQLKELTPGAKKVAGDQGRVILAPPVVRGWLIDEAIFTDNFEIARAYQKVLDGVLANHTKVERDLDVVLDRIAGIVGMHMRADELSAVGHFTESFLLETAQSRLTRAFIERALKLNVQAQVELAGLLGENKAHFERLKNLKTAREKLKLQRADDFRKLAIYGGLKGVGQVPWGIIPGNCYSLQPSSGVLTFSKLCCFVNHPIVYDQEDLVVLGDGCVTVTFGHELNYNESSDFTTVLFCKDGKGGAKLCGVNRPSAVKPHTVPAPDLVMYEEDNADPMNLKSCISQAEKKAKPILEGADTTEGFVTEFSGFVQCILERGVNSVQFVWEGGVAHTYVAVHSPGWAGPAGAAVVTKLLDVDGPARAAAKQAG